MIPYGRQDITQEDIDAVVEVLGSAFLTQGPLVPEFEGRVAGTCGAAHAVAVSSGTAALHLACLALGLGSGDRFWTSPITFVASANCALYCGAIVDFVDIDPETGNLSIAALTERLEWAEGEGLLPKVVMPVHFAGQPCDMAAVHALSRRFGFRIIEDATHALGATHDNRPVGSCRYSDITVFSFHPVKIITTGEGGMALTNDAALAARMSLLRSHGITRDPAEMTAPPEGKWCYEQQALGFNYRLTDLQAALGITQLDRLEGFVLRRRSLAVRYNGLLAGRLVSPLQREPYGVSSYHLYVVRLHGAVEDPGLRTRVFDCMRGRGIGVNVHYIPIPTQPWYREQGIGIGTYPGAMRYYREALTLPLWPGLREDEQDYIVTALSEALEHSG